ncbi:hypothetical protein SAMN05421788_106248 [Filimonas lacunae]|uniref:Uncharacterized protein n=1 Tax=Filimonas lacunae TaxID=477680 RepID=A0A1N7QQK8_9BACT|nr:hypothetical protein [Filimonas lacunae]SIT25151.1 hypothetical protein SAMN05421788_106248 [Filimonas lacunae]
MSKTGAIIIEAQDINTDIYREILRNLLSFNWCYTNNGLVSFMINGSHDYEQESVSNIEHILEKISNSVSGQMSTTIDLVYKESNLGIGLGFISSTRIFISIIDDVRMLPGLGIVDFSWYLINIKPLFELLKYYRVECIFD